MKEYSLYNAETAARRKARTWAIFEEDGSEDGRLVGGDMTAEDAEILAQGLEALGHRVNR